MHIDLLQLSLDIQKSQRSGAIQIFTLQTGYTRCLTQTRALTGFELVWLAPLGYETHMTHGTDGKLEHCWCANLITPVAIHGSLRDGSHGIH